MRPLRLAVDARDLVSDRRGIGTYARALLSRLARRDDIELRLLVRDWPPRRAAPALAAAIGLRGPQAVRCANRVPPDTDIVWHPWNGTFFASRAPAVATIHDVVAFALPAANAALRRSQQSPIQRTAATARAIVCDSDFTAQDVQRYLGVAPERVHAIALGVDPVFSPGNLDALPAQLRGRRYILYVGAHDAHKNVATLIKAYRLAFRSTQVALVFTRPNHLAPEAIVCERASLVTLVALYRGAAVVAVPSLYEGFGLPVLEGLACGAPVLAARATALPEAGGEVATYVDDITNPEAWRQALSALCADGQERTRTQRLGPVHAATFSWDRCTERTLLVLRAAAFGA